MHQSHFNNKINAHEDIAFCPSSNLLSVVATYTCGANAWLRSWKKCMDYPDLACMVHIVTRHCSTDGQRIQNRLFTAESVRLNTVIGNQPCCTQPTLMMKQTLYILYTTYAVADLGGIQGCKGTR